MDIISLPASFAELPIELKRLIVEAVDDRQDIRRLCLVSKIFQVLASPVLYRDFKFRSTSKSKRSGPMSDCRALLNMLQRGNNAGVSHIRKIEIILRQEDDDAAWDLEVKLVRDLLLCHIQPNTLKSLV